MLKTDKKNLDDLASQDESVRVQAAERLQQLDLLHFQHHPIDKFRFSAEQIASLLAAWHATSSELLKVWIVQVMALTRTSPPEVLPVMVDSLRLDGRYMPYVAQLLLGYRKQIPGGNELFKSLHRHPNPDVRWRSAMALRSMVFAKEFDYAKDMPILRALMLDTASIVRHEAVMTAKDISELGPVDYEVLLDLVNIDNSSARHYAKELMARLESEVPGCTPSAFAPREPLLRTDGIYSVEKAELDAAGNWVSYGLLRFLPGNIVHYFGTNESPVDWKTLLPGLKPTASQGVVIKNGAQVSFSVTGDDGCAEYEGHIDGSELHLKSMHRETGRCIGEKFTWVFIDWNAAPADEPAPTKTGKGKNKLPFIPARAKSMDISEAKKWYLQMLARLPSMLEEAQSEADKVALGWRIKSELREAAARALAPYYSKKDFFAKMPLPSLEELQGQEPAAAMSMLLTVTQAEMRAFPATIGESIGMMYWDGKYTWVMTENGWTLKT